MIVTASEGCPGIAATKVSEQDATVFERMLPTIRRNAEYAFRKVRPEHRQDLVADVVAKAYEAFVGLVARGKSDLAYATVLANFSIRQVRSGRKLGARQNLQEALCPHAQRRHDFTVHSLHQRNSDGHWEEMAVEDRRTTPANLATFRLDFRAWLTRLKAFHRSVALRLASGDTTTEAARRFQLSRGRISQLRQALAQDWISFQAVLRTATS